MPALQQQVRGDHDPPVGRADESGVVTRPEHYRRALGQTSGNTIYHTEFAEISDCDDAPPDAHRVRWPFGVIESPGRT
ncbi:hypothetical protein GCM10009733_074140 [Nonomuraea maheshkhaliensis]|uniref:Uncharacterized protein n=1 Tax=Nonomuraea maheshkhaliensis TaxID=419590 RepID=A0ABP4S102_9ACTN